MFVKEEFNPGSKAVYVKFTDYLPRKEPPSLLAGGKVVKVDRVEWIVYAGRQHGGRGAERRRGGLLSRAPPIDLLPLLKQSTNVKVEVDGSARLPDGPAPLRIT